MIEKYPYTDFNEFNLDWVIKKIREIESSMTDYEALHSITFGGDWDISKQYQAWVIVSDPVTHDGYLSLKPVPNNILLTDTEYWLKIADYTTGLANVNARVDAVENDITNNIKPDITAIENNITNNIEPDILAIQNDITNNITPAITDIQAKISGDRVVLAIGDSWQQGYNPMGNTVPFINKMKTVYEAVTCSQMTVYDYNYGGIGFLNVNDGKTYATLLTDAYNNISDHDAVTDVIVSGGYNDNGYTYSALVSAITLWVSTAHTYFPKARIWICPCAWCRGATERDHINNRVIPAYTSSYNALIMTSVVKMFHFYDLLNSQDYYHPTQTGQDILGNLVACELMGSPRMVNESNDGSFYSMTFTLNSSFYTSNLALLTVSRNENIISIWSDIHNFNTVGGYTFDADGSDCNALLKIDNSHFIGGQAHTDDYIYVTPAIFQDTNNKYAFGVLKFYVEAVGTDLYLKYHAVAVLPDGSNYMTNCQACFGFTLKGSTITDNLC